MEERGESFSDRPGGNSEGSTPETPRDGARSDHVRDSGDGAGGDGRPAQPVRKGPRTKRDWVDDIRRVADLLEQDDASTGDLKILARSLRELRYSFTVFSRYRHRRKVSVFGSARTKPEDPAYRQAVELGRRMAEHDWMVLTGAGGGIMEAAHVGAGREMSLGVNILLPFEQQANPVIADDEKLVHLRYFFTRKLLFVKEVSAVVLFPGGFGTQDEGFETLTLIQTGKRDMMPIVCIDPPHSSYWERWDAFVRDELLAHGLISPSDTSLYHRTQSVDDAVGHVLQFYRVYHSMRYIRDVLYFRLLARPSAEFIERLNDEFGDILVKGRFECREPHAHEADETHIVHLPRLTFAFNRRDFGRLRQLIDYLNRELEPDPELVAEAQRRLAAREAPVSDIDPED
ncbi:MAG: LOG family protein [Planctomycetota bacterium]|nr:MAG: LOG family protein [Planctomycetota bacterium]